MPTPDPRLLKDNMRILASDISETATTIPLTASPEGFPIGIPHGYRGNSMIIDQEIINFGDLNTGPPYTISKCVRGAHGTRAAPHSRGSRIYHLAEIYNMFLVNGNTNMVEEVAQNIADMI